MADFNPSRLTLARKRNGFTQARLHRETDISTRSLTAYEAGTTEPQPESVALIAKALAFPVDFFYGPEIEEPAVDGVSFRALSKMTAGKRDQAIAAAAFALALADWIDLKFNVPAPDVPQLRGVDAETASAAVRASWNLGERPVANMIRTLEKHGVRVFSLAEDYDEVDAFSFWRNGVPYIFLNTRKSAERSRMDAAHELGHLVMHWDHDAPRGRSLEQQADHFGSSFLMPAGSVIAEAPRTGSLAAIIKAKKRWKVSAAALAVRMYHLGLLSEWQYRSVFIELSEAGYTKSEPEGIERETSRVLPKVLALAKTMGMSKADIASLLVIPQVEIEKLIFGLALTPIQGGGETAPTSEPAPARLRLV